MRVMDRVHLVGRGEWRGVPRLCRGDSCNVYLIDGGSEATLVDAGMPDSADDILANVRAAGVDPARIRTILLTHSHWDHAAGVAALVQRTDAQVCCHTIARDTLTTGRGIYAEGYHMPRHHNGPVHRVLAEGDTVRVGELSLEVIELPGHTPDGLGFVLRIGHQLTCFTGDTAIGDQPPTRGVIGWIDGHWGSSLTPFHHSLERLAGMNLDTVFPGHGEPHVGRSKVATSLANCLWRLGLLRSIPDLDTMMPVQP